MASNLSITGYGLVLDGVTKFPGLLLSLHYGKAIPSSPRALAEGKHRETVHR